MSNGKSGQQKGAENVGRLHAYLAALQAEGRALPERGGKANLTAIALACGFDRNVLYANPAAKLLIEEAAVQLGLEMPAQEARDQPEAASGAADPRDRRIHQLEQANAALKAENGALRAERNGMRERLRRYAHIEAHMAETGRRVAP